MICWHRYGAPCSDQVLVNRHHSVGYCYRTRQARWALEIVDPDTLPGGVDRQDNFRPDLRVPAEFRAELSDYRGTGFDRGHLAAAANLNDTEAQISETFLLSNMCPQASGLNRGAWRLLEAAVRELNASTKVLETYVLTGPLFDFTKPIQLLGEDGRHGKQIPVPSHFFKCVLVETTAGSLKQWAFIMRNRDDVSTDLSTHLVQPARVERWGGFRLWDAVVDARFEATKGRVGRMWSGSL